MFAQARGSKYLTEATRRHDYLSIALSPLLSSAYFIVESRGQTNVAPDGPERDVLVTMGRYFLYHREPR